MKHTKIFLMFLIVILPAIGESGNSWKYWKKEKDSVLYKRNYIGSSIIEVKAVRTIKAPPEVIEAVLRDVPAYPKFMYQCIRGKTIKKFSDEKMIIHNVTKMPWPLKPRDVVVKTRVRKNFNKGKFSVILAGLSSKESRRWVPVSGKYVRMDNLTGTFIVKLLKRDSCRVSYIVHADPKGIPGFVVNLFCDENPAGTLEGLARMVKKHKYISAGKKSKYLAQIEKYFSNK